MYSLSKTFGLFFVLFAMCLFGRPAEAQYGGGTGEPNDPYQIATAEQLISIGSDPNLLDKHFILINDIDLDPNLPGGRVFNQAVIASDLDGESKLPQSVFTGSLDGKGHRINNLTIRGKADNLGLFRRIWDGHVLNLGLENVSIFVINASKSMAVGCLVGRNHGGRITNCYAKGTVTVSKSSTCIGGLVGFNREDGSIINCRAAVNISGGDKCQNLGGLVGMSFGTISNCYANAHVLVGHETDYLGGLVGYAPIGGITNCYATGSISSGDGSSGLGGLVGGNGGTITDSYAASSVVAGQNARNLGGLVGENWEHASKCYFLSPSDGGGPDNGVGSSLTDEQMKRQANFVDWDFEEVWTICQGKDYPRLRPEAQKPPKPSPPDLSRCTRLKINLFPSTIEYIFLSPKDQNVLSIEEIEYLKSLKTIILDDKNSIEDFARDVSSASYSRSGGTVGIYNIVGFNCYHNGEHMTTFTDYGGSIRTQDGHWFDYNRRSVGLKTLTPQIWPYILRRDCSHNLMNLWGWLSSLFRSEKVYPLPTQWCDALVRHYQVERRLSKEKLPKELRCPSAGEGKCHYAMNPDCKPDSRPDTVLLFETKAGWNQHGGPELFTFDNHDPKGGCVLLNDGTVKFIRTKEELQQLRWK